MLDHAKRLATATSFEYGLIAIGICAGVVMAVASALFAHSW
jgi:hypothetical protein